MTARSDRHNAATLPVLQLMVKLVGPDPIGLLVLAESMVVGVFMLIIKLGGDEPVLDNFIDDVRKRLAEQRLGGIDPEGRG